LRTIPGNKEDAGNPPPAPIQGIFMVYCLIRRNGNFNAKGFRISLMKKFKDISERVSAVVTVCTRIPKASILD
jgi:hypothetical protein